MDARIMDHFNSQHHRVGVEEDRVAVGQLMKRRETLVKSDMKYSTLGYDISYVTSPYHDADPYTHVELQEYMISRDVHGSIVNRQVDTKIHFFQHNGYCFMVVNIFSSVFSAKKIHDSTDVSRVLKQLMPEIESGHFFRNINNIGTYGQYSHSGEGKDAISFILNNGQRRIYVDLQPMDQNTKTKMDAALAYEAAAG